MTATPTVSGVEPPSTNGRSTATPDPRRWFTLAIVVMSVLIVALDTTVLNVAIPTILRDLDTTLPSLQWVITGYSLTFASLLIIGGRLADLFGAAAHVHRRRGAVRRRLAARVARAVGARPHRGRGDHRGHRRVPDDAGHARHPLVDLPGPRACDRLRDLGCDGRRRGGDRSARRRLPDHRLLVALVVPHQRDRRAARDPRSDALHAAQPARRAPGADRHPGSAPRRVRDVPAGVQPERGHPLRLVEAAGVLRAARRRHLAGEPPGVDRPAHAAPRRSRSSPRSSRSSGARSDSIPIRCSSSGSSASSASATA